MNVTVDNVTLSPGSTTALATGLDESGNRVVFAGDWRPMQDLAEMVEQEGTVEAYVEDWQVRSVVPPPDLFEVVGEGYVKVDLLAPKEDDRG